MKMIIKRVLILLIVFFGLKASAQKKTTLLPLTADSLSFFDRADFELEDFAAAFSDFFAITICFSFQCLPAGNLPLQVSFRKLSRRLTF